MIEDVHDLFLDRFSLYRLAVALRLRHEATETGGPVAGDAAFKAAMGFDYTPQFSIKALEDSPDLNNQLIEILEFDQKIAAGDEDLRAERAKTAARYDLLRYMVAPESINLIVPEIDLVNKTK